MQPLPADTEIRSQPAFPRLVSVVRVSRWVGWVGLPVFTVFALLAVFGGHVWPFVVAGVLAVCNGVFQLVTAQRARRVLSEISGDQPTRSRAWMLARSDVAPSLLRLLRRA